MSEPIFRLSGIRRSFLQGRGSLDVLRGVDLAIPQGGMVALVGPSGAGKSTLLHIAGLLERPDAGEVVIGGTVCSGLGEDRRTALRREKIGFVYQYHHLLPEFSALENVVIPQLIRGRSRKAAEARAIELLTGVGLDKRLDHRPAELSGGEQQRTAICRALANGPRLILADEPTGNLDPKTSEHVFHELIALIRTTGVAALIATHNMELARRMDRVLTLADGLLQELHPGSVGQY